MEISTKKAIPIFMLFTLGLILSGCSVSDDGGPMGSSEPQPGSNTVEIGPFGGNINYANATVTIPLIALSEAVDIVVGIPDTPPAYNQPEDVVQVGDVYEFGPTGTQFNMNIIVKFDYSENDLGGNNETTIAIWTFEGDDDDPVALTRNVVDMDNNTVSGETDHFSFFFLGVSTAECAAPPGMPTLIFPLWGDRIQPYDITFSWNSVPYADWYHFQLYAGGNIFVEELNITGTTYTLIDAGLTSECGWNVRAHNECGYGDWPEGNFFYILDASGSGGNLVGTWQYDHTIIDGLGYPGVSMEMSETGSGSIVFTNTTFLIDQTRILDYQASLMDTVLIDTIITYMINQGGTFTAEDDYLLAWEITWDNINPENVGEHGQGFFTINGSILELYYHTTKYGFYVDFWDYYIRQ
jgi:hypothetical protein